MGRRVDAEGAAAEIGAVEIELEDLVLRQPRFQPERQEGLLDLALERALVRQEQVLRKLLADRGAALHHAARARIGEHGAEQAGHVDAEMLVEAAVLGGERRLDQVIGKLVERDRIVVADAARANLVAVAVEEGDGEVRFLEPVVVGRLAEGRDGERQQNHEAAGAERQPFRHGLHENPAPPARDMEAVHELGEALVDLARPGAGLVETEIDARIEIEEEPAKPRSPAVPVVVSV